MITVHPQGSNHLVRGWARGVQSPPKRIVCRFHYHSQKVIGSLGYVLEPKWSIFWKIQPIKLKVNPPKKLGHSASRLLYVYVTYNWMSQLISVGMLMLVIGPSRNVPWIVGFFPKWSSGIALCQKVWLIFFYINLKKETEKESSTDRFYENRHFNQHQKS